MGQGMAMEVFLVPTSLTSPNLHWAAGSKGTTACIGFMQGFSADLGKRPELGGSQKALKDLQIVGNLK